MLLVGSQGLAFVTNTVIPSKDVDFICTLDEYNTWVRKHKPQSAYPMADGSHFFAKKDDKYFEFEIAWSSSSARELLDRVQADPTTQQTPDGIHVLPLNLQYALKLSHRYKKNSPHFLKTMGHIYQMRALGAVFPEEYRDWFKKRETETYDYKHPNLNQGKSGFFDVNQGVIYTYDHDSIHLAMAVGPKPAYSYFKPADTEVRVSKKMFFELDRQIQLNSVLEESYVLALERSQVPFKGQIDPKKSFEIALSKCCTSIASGWWREFAWENYYDVLALYDDGYVERFWAGVENGTVRLANSEQNGMIAA